MCLALLCQAIQLAISTTLACFILLVLHLFSVICISQAAFYDKNKGFVFWFYWKLWLFLYARLKKKTYYGNTCSVQRICLLNNFNSFHCIIFKLCENVCWQNVSAKFDNQPDPMKHLWPLIYPKLS